MSRRSVDIPTARVFRPLLERSRDLVAYGGRGSGKSHFFAGLMVERAVMQPGFRGVCVREVQKDLKDSAKLLIEDKLREFGVSASFDVQRDLIVTPGGGQIIFRGMKDYNADSIKSLEGFDVAWVEEAQSITQRSITLLRPTIRKTGSELWWSFNPSRKDDPVETMFRGDAPRAGAIIVKANWSDNPWFPEVLNEERAADLTNRPDDYGHIWEGDYQTRSQAQVFRNWTVEPFETPPDAVLRFGADWGFSVDPTVLVRCHIQGRRLYIDQCVSEVGCEIDRTPALFDKISGARKWPIRADSSRPETISYMRRAGFKIVPAIKGPGSVEDGVEFLRSFDIVVHPRCPDIVRQELETYAYKTDRLTGEVLPILEDKDNHCIPAGELVWLKRGLVPIENVTIGDFAMTRKGWRVVTFAGITDYDRDVVEVMTTLGTLRCTPDHKIWTTKGFVRADALRYGDEVLGDKSWSKLSSGTVKNGGGIQREKANQARGILLERLAKEASNFIAQCGNITTELFRQGITFTTKITTHPTTTSATLSALAPKSIWQSATPIAMRAKNGPLSILDAFATSQKRGTQVQRVVQNIKRLVQWRGLGLSRKRDSVRIVPQITRNTHLANVTHFAQTLANLLRVERLASITSNVIALFAKQHGQSVDIQKRKPVHGHVLTVKEAGTSPAVYDLTIEGEHEFFCEGFLVSNCIDALRYSLEAARKAQANTVIEKRYVPLDYRSNKPKQGAASWKTI